MVDFHFTNQVRHALQQARDEAIRLGHDWVGTEHLLLGLLLCDHCLAVTVLAGLGCDRDTVRADVERAVKRGDPAARAELDVPYTTRAKKVLELAMATSRDLAHDSVGTEHLLLGLVREAKGIAAQVLERHGISEERLRAATFESRRDGQSDQPATPSPAEPEVTAVTVTLELANGQRIAVRFRNAGEAIDYLRQGRIT